MADDKKNIPEAAPPAGGSRSHGRKCSRAGAARSRACADRRGGGHAGT